MAVIRNLMIRIGADYSPAKKAMDGASRELTKFRRDTERTTRTIRGQKGLGGVTTSYKELGRELTASISRLRGARGIGGVTAELCNLVPVASRSAKSLTSVGESAATLSSRLGTAGIAVTAFTAVVGGLTAGIAAASQEAIRFEATIGRLNMQLRGGAREFMDWARAQGLAKTTAADMGATYGTLLSSFISDTDELSSQVQKLVQSTRVVASHTGRSIEDVMERMRSGLLGNTEAIEDLGIFVNVAMIESTQAFRRFAGDRSWDQLDFQMQQQIRLAAILEQAYARYGNELQNNTMTKQDRLLEQLKDIKLNLSQAFQPIYDAVLPALTRLAEGIARVTENIARFFFSLRGWDYDEMTRGTDEQTDAVDDQGKAYDDLAGSVKKARTELASFDELNLIGDRSGGAGGGTGGTGGTTGPNIPAVPTDPIKISFEWDIPDPPEVPAVRIPPPQPPDAGIGAVATAVTSTVTEMAAQTRARFANLWQGVHVDTLGWSSVLQGAVAGMMTGIAVTTGVNLDIVGLDWRSTLQTMLADLNTYQPSISTSWDRLMTKVSSIANPLADVRLDWKSTLSFMQQNLDAYRPYLEWGWHLIAVAVRKPINPLADLKLAWQTTLNDMYQAAASRFGAIVTEANRAVQAIASLRAQLNMAPQQQPQPATVPAATVPAHLADLARQSLQATTPKTGPAAQRPDWVNEAPVIGDIYAGLDWVAQNISKPLVDNFGGLVVPGAGAAAAGARGAASAGAAIGKYVDDAMAALQRWMQGLGTAVPQFATGGAVFGPTLAMIGDNPGARHDPEIAAPQSYIEEAVSSGNEEVVRLLGAILQAVREGKTVQAVIAEGDVGRAATNYIRAESRRGRAPLQGV